MRITAPFRALVIAHLFYCVAPAGEADYTLDDSFWNEESPVEKKLRSTSAECALERKDFIHIHIYIYLNLCSKKLRIENAQVTLLYIYIYIPQFAFKLNY
uniref:Uncharacterized protein n=1 Tax=Glossina morsitans morsitans TaxID=37546 RepID=A0A1B0FKX0_GLOMM